MWLELPIGPFRVSTALTAIALGVWLLWRYRRWTAAVAGVMAWLAAYEVLYIGTGTLLHGWPFSAFLWTANLSAWVLLAWVIGVRPNPWLLLPFGASWLIWMAIGFVANTPGYPWRWDDEVINVITKSVLAVAYAVPATWSPLMHQAGSPAHRTDQ